ncbi:hypothetical protein [Aliidiomarina celeris]|uniref:hypothetical protein n=1 Tax=Aliidiomarina celeris TaxID=2249428 RepID=UPI000DE88058|nr:hypothetical protein [Aliidiomarina celeris]
MKHGFRSVLTVFSVTFLLACQTVPEFQAANLAYEQPAEQWAGNAQKPVAALRYLLGENAYSAQVYAHGNERVTVLFENDQLVAVTRHGSRGLQFSACTQFPLAENFNVESCLQEYTSKVVSERLQLPDTEGDLQLADNSTSPADYGGYFMFGTMVALYPPVLYIIPAMVVTQGPDALMTRQLRRSFTGIRLGMTKSEIEQHGIKLAKGAWSTNNRGDETLLLAAGYLREPAVAMGFQNDQLAWLNTNPNWVCNGVFNLQQCRVGAHPMPTQENVKPSAEFSAIAH